MKTYLIGLDLVKTGHDYKDLTDKITNFEAYWHCIGSIWIVKTNSSPEEIRDSLQLDMEESDKILVVELTANASWYGFNDDCSNWLTDNL